MIFFKRKKKKGITPDPGQAATADQGAASTTAESEVSANSNELTSGSVESKQPESSKQQPEPSKQQPEPSKQQPEPSKQQPKVDNGLASAEQSGLDEEREPGQSTEASRQKASKLGFFARIRRGLSRTSGSFTEGLGTLLLGKKEIDEDLFEEIETQLLVADIGVEATSDIIEDLTARVARKQLSDGDALYAALQDSLRSLLQSAEQPLVVEPRNPFVILIVGVNGVGKTTTIGKLAKRLQQEGKSVILAAGDTFRAAAVEQLQVWGSRNNVPVVAQHTGADSASVIYDAIQSAKARGVDVVIADTAGRLHTKSNLMEELAKVRRVMGKLDASAPHEVLLVLDAGTGQNAINQAEQFRAAAGVTGIALTKLDGTAKGGIIFALTKKFGLPVRFIGVGEGIEDLQPFNAEAFVKALFSSKEL